MEFNLPTLLGISLAAMFFGYFFGLFEGRGQGYKKRRKEEELDKPAIPPTPAAPKADAGTTSAHDSSLLRLGLDATQQPTLEIDGRRVDTSALAPEQRKRLIDLMLVMRPWVESGTAKAAGAPSPESAPVSRPSMVERFRAAAGTTPSSNVVSAGPTPAALRAGAVAPADAAAATAPTTMVAQIDAILQVQLAGTQLADRGIRLAESLHGGAIVMVGTNRYEGVGDVPDPDVQAAIRAAIAEWEKRYTPG